MEYKSFEDILNETGCLFYKCVGVSMLPLVREDTDYVYIKKRSKERLKKYDVVMFRRPGVIGRGAYVLHRILKVKPEGTYWIVGDNCIGGEIVKEENILGVLTCVKRKNKIIKVSDFGYKLYTYLWCVPWPLRIFLLRCRNLLRRIVGKVLRILHVIS